MKIAICEDEEIYATMEVEELHKLFPDGKDEPVIDVFEDGLPLLEKLQSGTVYDLLLLDLQLQNSDGMEVAEEVRKIDKAVPVIFVTGIEERAAEGYGVDAFDYVVKSRLSDRLSEAVERLKRRWQEDRLTLDTREGETVILSFREILWVESEKRGVKVVTAGGEYGSVQPVGKIAPLLPEYYFAEVYKSVFANITAIKRIGSDCVEMCNGAKLPLSRRKRTMVMNQVLQTVKGGR